MSRRQLLGTIVYKDGYYSLLTSARCWYPLQGSSEIAEKFRETFGNPHLSDLGRRLYCYSGLIQMENIAQRDTRIAEEMEKDREGRAPE